jgi:DNA-binding NarL/FixJ family response regulator
LSGVPHGLCAAGMRDDRRKSLPGGGGRREVAVLDPLPLVRLGALAALGGGVELASGDDLTAWLDRQTSGILLLTVHDEDSWSRLAAAEHHADVRTVAVLAPFTETRAARALRLGAAHVAARDNSAEAFRRVVRDVEDGIVRVPLSVMRAATAVPRHGVRRDVEMSDAELGWLRSLAEGRTMASVAAGSGYSERALYRKLSEVYRALGVANRTQALIVARDEGWL